MSTFSAKIFLLFCIFIWLNDRKKTFQLTNERMLIFSEAKNTHIH